jgi:hypothetical protein
MWMSSGLVPFNGLFLIAHSQAASPEYQELLDWVNATLPGARHVTTFAQFRDGLVLRHLVEVRAMLILNASD